MAMKYVDEKKIEARHYLQDLSDDEKINLELIHQLNRIANSMEKQ